MIMKTLLVAYLPNKLKFFTKISINFNSDFMLKRMILDLLLWNLLNDKEQFHWLLDASCDDSTNDYEEEQFSCFWNYLAWNCILCQVFPCNIYVKTSKTKMIHL